MCAALYLLSRLKEASSERTEAPSNGLVPLLIVLSLGLVGQLAEIGHHPFTFRISAKVILSLEASAAHHAPLGVGSNGCFR